MYRHTRAFFTHPYTLSTQNEYIYTRVYKNGEHNEILRRCARARVVNAASCEFLFTFAPLIFDRYFAPTMKFSISTVDAEVRPGWHVRVIHCILGSVATPCNARMGTRNAKCLAVRWIIITINNYCNHYQSVDDDERSNDGTKKCRRDSIFFPLWV